MGTAAVVRRQRQRVAMGRAIVRQPRAFLMDEPLSNLDAKLRVQMRAEIARLQRSLGVTTSYVTHDQTEAMTLGNRVAVLQHGVLQQVAPPQELYSRPANLFVAPFIGSPSMNLLEATVERGDGGPQVCFGTHRLTVAGQAVHALDPRTTLAESQAAKVHVDLAALHFFDPQTGASLRQS
jgi:multiple sugar transport system ATP-binding protein